MLERIIEKKKQELAAAAGRTVQESIWEQLDQEVPSFSEALRKPSINIIAEIKYSSPSHGPFTCQDPPEKIAESYAEAGAAALSVLTDQTFFSGNAEFLTRARKTLSSDERFRSLPLLRKDFIIDRNQIVEARQIGASACLLIAACLSQMELQGLIEAGVEQGLDSLVEVHDPYELEKSLEAGAAIIGVNNRNLKTFEVDLRTSFDLARRLEGEDRLIVAESGISEPQQIVELKDAGFSAFLIGTTFMDSRNPGLKLRELLERL